MLMSRQGPRKLAYNVGTGRGFVEATLNLYYHFTNLLFDAFWTFFFIFRDGGWGVFLMCVFL